MRLVDTSAWVEWLTGSALGLTLAAELPEREQWLVPTMVQLELAKWLAREADEARADRAIAFTVTCVVASLDTATAVSAAELCVRHKLATTDAIVYATALRHGADMLTCDRHFENLPAVRFVAKPRSRLFHRGACNAADNHTSCRGKKGHRCTP